MSFTISPDERLQQAVLLDSASTEHVANNRDHLRDYHALSEPEYLLGGGGEVEIQGYGTLQIPTASGKYLTLTRVAYCPDMPTNLVSLRRLMTTGIYFDSLRMMLRRANGCSVHRVTDQLNQFVLHEFPSVQRIRGNAFKMRRRTAAQQRSTADGHLWHLRMGHAGAQALERLETSTRNAEIRGPKVTKCEACAVSKTKEQISRSEPETPPVHPFDEVSIDMHPMQGHRIYTRYLLITCRDSDFVMPYMLTTDSARSILEALIDAYCYTRIQFKTRWRKVRSDNELMADIIQTWFRAHGVKHEPSAPNTQAQNGRAERSGGVIGEMARTMRIHARLPEELWPSYIQAACYIHNRLPRAQNQWMTPYELVYNMQRINLGLQGDWTRPSISHMRAYGCKAYVKIADVEQKKRKLFYKLNPRAEIGYLIGYAASNIYRIWIPHSNKIKLARDVTFDETQFFSGKTPELDAPTVRELDEVIEMVSVPNQEDFDDIWQLPEGWVAQMPSDEHTATTDSLGQLIEGLQQLQPGDHGDNDDTSTFSQDTLSIAHSESTAPTIYSSEPDREQEQAFEHVEHNTIRGSFYAGRTIGKRDIAARLESLDRSEGLEEAAKRPDATLIKDLPPPPKNRREMLRHRFMKEFQEAEREHMQTHKQAESFTEVPKEDARSSVKLSSMWVYTYKADQDGKLVKFKARLVIRGDMEPKTAEDVYAATLAARSFRVLMALTAKYDLDSAQLDAVNAFMNAKLDRIVYMHPPEGHSGPGVVYRLNKAMYGLRRSPLLWQRDLRKALEELGFQAVPQEQCVMVNGDIIAFYFVDDIVLLYPRQQQQRAQRILGDLRSRYELKGGDPIEWFLGVHVIRDRGQKKLWLSQAAYIDKIFQYADSREPSRSATTPMLQEELMQYHDEPSRQELKQYQRKVGSIQYAAVVTRPDVAFAASRLARYNTRPGPLHQAAADHVLHYLKNTRDQAIEYDGTRADDGWIIASDASFADNADRKSSQGWIMKLCGGSIAWRATKQPTVTTSTTEAELLAVSETAREAMFMARLLKALDKQLEAAMTIQCDNQQTVGLLTKENAVLNTRLRHVDIHNHWLRQEVQRQHIRVVWVETAKMVADGLTKALPRQKFETFRKACGLQSIRHLISEDAD